ncbi:MAG: helix-turn-helix transcriptional regulator [Burkholderiaceae bacterium]
MTTAELQTGDYLRVWRQRRGMSQLELALEAEISQRHLSFVESGRSRPSREMVLRLTERLDIPLRERNAVLLAAGFAPFFGEHSLDDPAMANARDAIEMILKGHEPFPALAVDRHWNLVMANDALAPLLAGVEDQSLLAAPVNALRLSLHPGGLAPRIANLAEWRSHLLDRLRRQIAATRDDVLVGLMHELAAYPVGDDDSSVAPTDFGGVLVPLKLKTEAGLLSFLSTTTMFGTPRDVLLSEIAIEAFFPADAATRRILKPADDS